MIKKLTLLFLAAVLFAPSFALGAYQTALRVKAREVVDHQNSFLLIEDNGETWLIHHETGCGSVQEGDPLTLVITGELDGNQDRMWKGDYASCTVDMAEKINGRLRVTTTSSADNFTSVSDGGKPYRIYYSERCKAMKGLKDHDVYVHKYGGSQLRAGDKFFLPSVGEMCSITYVQSEIYEMSEPSSTATTTVTVDDKRPTTPTNVRAFPSNTAVYLYWRASEDDVAIDHYVVSASLYHRDDPVAQDPEIKPQYMPDTVVTQGNRPSIKLENLEPDELYFFRVIAVDSSGNESSYWSEEATAFTKSSIAQTSLENSALRLFQAQETDTSYLFRWNSLPGAKYSVVLEADNERVFVSNSWNKNYIRILKKPSRKGKRLELIVRSLDFRGINHKAVAEFSF